MGLQCVIKKKLNAKILFLYFYVHQTRQIKALGCLFVLHCKPIPYNEYRVPARFFALRIYYTGKTLFLPCTGPVRDCSVLTQKSLTNFHLLHFCHHANCGVDSGPGNRTQVPTIQNVRCYPCNMNVMSFSSISLL